MLRILRPSWIHSSSYTITSSVTVMPTHLLELPSPAPILFPARARLPFILMLGG